MNKKIIVPIAILLAVIVATSIGLVAFLSGDDSATSADSVVTEESDHPHDDDGNHIDEDDDHEGEEIGFIDGALISTSSVDCTLGNGDAAQCNEFTIAGLPADYEIGPFCPTTITTSADDAGLWLDGENIYDADGEFISSLAEIYGDDNWKLYNDDGTVNITDTAEAFDAAARPDVDPEYQNYCVEGKIEWTETGEAVQVSYTIPANPVLADSATQVAGQVGITYGGVGIDPAAPVDAILGAYTIATFDDCGGHVNPVAGYHQHAATGCSEVGELFDGETRAFALALDGFNIHSPYEAGEEPADLDECNGHTTAELGYHYHANAPEDNAVLTCYMGELESSTAAASSDAGGPPGGGGPPR